MRVHLMILAVFLALAPQVLAAEPAKVGNVIIHDAWVRAPLDVDHSSAAYMTLELADNQADRLLAAETPAAQKTELRTYWLEGCFTHSPQLEAIEVSPGKRTVLDSGGPHIQLVGVQRQLVEGTTIPLTLTFEKAGRIEIEVPVQEQRRLPADGQGKDLQASTN
jgi:periplasmic copper chaperone A